MLTYRPEDSITRPTHNQLRKKTDKYVHWASIFFIFLGGTSISKRLKRLKTNGHRPCPPYLQDQRRCDCWPCPSRPCPHPGSWPWEWDVKYWMIHNILWQVMKIEKIFCPVNERIGIVFWLWVGDPWPLPPPKLYPSSKNPLPNSIAWVKMAKTNWIACTVQNLW